MDLNLTGLLDVLGKWGIAGAVVFSNWMWLRYLERKDSDEIANLQQRVAALETNSSGHKEWLKDHSHAIKKKANKSHVARVVNRRREVGEG